MLGLRPPGFEFRVLCLEGSVIAPSSGVMHTSGLKPDLLVLRLLEQLRVPGESKILQWFIDIIYLIIYNLAFHWRYASANFVNFSLGKVPISVACIERVVQKTMQAFPFLYAM